jgi:hypothetical protein
MTATVPKFDLFGKIKYTWCTKGKQVVIFVQTGHRIGHNHASLLASWHLLIPFFGSLFMSNE